MQGKPEIHKFFQTQKISFDPKQNIDISLYSSKEVPREGSSDSLDGPHQNSQGSNEQKVSTRKKVHQPKQVHREEPNQQRRQAQQSEPDASKFSQIVTQVPQASAGPLM